ncbi:hypothetical protein GGR57DRAFT_506936 [Xylariaceae sp. FL1272]|nr:hypothetical protein GGR57DRAFT_506936 [Xylariaceae sp. FL1272]
MAEEIPPPHLPSSPAQNSDVPEFPGPGSADLGTGKRERRAEDENKSANDVDNNSVDGGADADETSPNDSGKVKLGVEAECEAELKDEGKEDKHKLPLALDAYPLTTPSTSTRRNPPKPPNQEIAEYLTNSTMGTTSRDLDQANGGEAATPSSLDTQTLSEGEQENRDVDADESFPVLIEFKPHGLVPRTSKPAIGLIQSQDTLIKMPFLSQFSKPSEMSDEESPNAEAQADAIAVVDSDTEETAEVNVEVEDEIEKDQYGFPLIWDIYPTSSPRRSSVSSALQQQAAVEFLKAWHNADGTVPFGPVRDHTTNGDININKVVCDGNVVVVSPKTKLFKRRPDETAPDRGVVQPQNAETEPTRSQFLAVAPDSSVELSKKAKEEPKQEKELVQAHEQAPVSQTPESQYQPFLDLLVSTFNHYLCCMPGPSTHNSEPTKDSVPLSPSLWNSTKEELLRNGFPACWEVSLSTLERSFLRMQQKHQSIRPQAEDLHASSPIPHASDLPLRVSNHLSPREQTIEPHTSPRGEPSSLHLDQNPVRKEEEEASPEMPCPTCGPPGAAAGTNHINHHGPPSSPDTSDSSSDPEQFFRRRPKSPTPNSRPLAPIPNTRALSPEQQILAWNPRNPPRVRARSRPRAPEPFGPAPYPKPTYLNTLTEAQQIGELCQMVNHLQKDIIFLMKEKKEREDAGEKDREEAEAAQANVQAANVHTQPSVQAATTHPVTSRPSFTHYPIHPLPTLLKLLKTTTTCIIYALLFSIAFRCINNVFPLHPLTIHPANLSVPTPETSPSQNTLPRVLAAADTTTVTETETTTLTMFIPSPTTEIAPQMSQDEQTQVQMFTNWIWSIAGYHAAGQ